MILRQTIRSFLQQPAFVIVAVTTLALGIGAATSIFSVIESVLLRPLPYDEPERLVIVWETEPDRGEVNVAGANFLDWQEHNETFAGMTAFAPVLLTRTGDDVPERLSGVEVSPNFFDVMGRGAHLGRTFVAGEGDAHATILSYEYWERAFGGDDDVLGETLTLNERAYTVIGIAPDGFELPFENADVWIRAARRVPAAPIDVGVPPDELRGLHWLRVLARLESGTTLERAQADLDVIAARLREAHSEDNAGRGVRILPLHEQVTGDVRPALLVLFGAVGLLLVIACANVANLLLARASGREREVAVRSALGASRARIVTELLVESMSLALAGGALGLVMSHALTRVILLWGPEHVFRLDDVSLNPVVLGFSIAVSMTTGLVFGILPAMQASNPALAGTLKEGGRGGSGAPGKKLRGTLVVVEVGLALVLLVLSGLLVRSFVHLRGVDPGFESTNVLTLRLWLPDTRYGESDAIAAAYRSILERLDALAGVESASGVLGVPLSGTAANFGVTIEGREPPPPDERLSAGFQSVAPGYFRTMGIPMLRGRDFTPADDADSTAVAVISATAAERFWPGEDPMGRRFSQDGEQWFEVVGIVSDVLHTGLDQAPRADVYAPFQQVPFPFMTLVVKTRVAPEALARAAISEIRAVDADLPVYKVMPLESVVADSVAAPRFNTFLLGVFALAAIALAAVGLYGLMAYSVSQRRREIGIRIALGAERGKVVSLVVREGLGLALAGVVIGLVGALAASRLLAAFLFEVTATDVGTYGGTTLVLLVVAVVASAVPARRAARVDPLVALRYE